MLKVKKHHEKSESNACTVVNFQMSILILELQTEPQISKVHLV